MRRLVAVLIAALAAMLYVGGYAGVPAWAHASLVSSDPESGAVLDELPDQMTFTFSDDVVAPAYVVVTAPDGSSAASGDVVIGGDTVTQKLADIDLEGTYTAAYRAVSADGHQITGQINFSVGEPSSGSAGSAGSSGSTDQTDESSSESADTSGGSAAAPSSSDSSLPGWRFWVGATLFGAAAVFWLASRRTSAT